MPELRRLQPAAFKAWYTKSLHFKAVKANQLVNLLLFLFSFFLKAIESKLISLAVWKTQEGHFLLI